MPFHAPNRALRIFAVASIVAAAAIFMPVAIAFLARGTALFDADIGLVAMTLGLVVAPLLAGANAIIAATVDRRDPGSPARVAWIAVVVCTLATVACFAAARGMHGHWP